MGQPEASVVVANQGLEISECNGCFFISFYIFLMLSTLLFLAVCRTHVAHEHGEWPSSPRVLKLSG